MPSPSTPPPKGATGVFRVVTECHYGPTKGNCPLIAVQLGSVSDGGQGDYPVAMEGKAGGRLLFQPMNRVGVPDDLDGVVLSGARGYKLEGCLSAKVLESLAGFPAHIHLFDVVHTEVVGGDSTFGFQFHMVGAHVAELDRVACQHLFAQARHGIGEDALDGALGEGRIVVGDVLAEGVEIESVMNLRSAVGLGLLDVLLLGPGLRAHNANAVVNHGFCFFSCWFVFLSLVSGFGYPMEF